MYNEAHLVGRLGRDPELKQSSYGAIATLNLATHERWKNKAGEQQETTEWHNIVVYGKLAEIVGQYYRKGQKLMIKGKIVTQSWDDKKTGEKKYKTVIEVNGYGGKIINLGNDAPATDRQETQKMPSDPISKPVEDVVVAQDAGFADDIPF